MKLELSDAEQQILMSALNEFDTARGPTVEEYVARRYDAAVQGENWIATKIKDVKAKLVIADALRTRIGRLSLDQ